MKFTKTFILVFALLLLGTNYVKADDMVQTDFSKPFTGLADTTIISSKPKDCDFQVNQTSKDYTTSFDKTNSTTTGETTAK
jgi:hypothetical protein